jgi:hypothetical protein
MNRTQHYCLICDTDWSNSDLCKHGTDSPLLIISEVILAKKKQPLYVWAKTHTFVGLGGEYVASLPSNWVGI